MRHTTSTLRRRLAGTAEVTFDIIKSLADTGSTDAASFSDTLSAELVEALSSGTLSTNIESECGCEATVTSVAVVVDGYSPKSVQESWDNHFQAFADQDLDQIMLDYVRSIELLVINSQAPYRIANRCL